MDRDDASAACSMTLDLASYRRTSGWLGRSFTYYASIGSTNDAALAASAAGAEEGLVIVADVQQSGRGRLNRRWEADAGSNLLVSLLFRPPDPFAYHAGRTTMVCGLGLQAAVRVVSGLDVKLKWPNDLIFELSAEQPGWLKLAGMLSEFGTGVTGRPEALVVGIGVNVNVDAAQLSGLALNAGSLSALTGTPIRRAHLLDHLLVEIERRYDALLAGVDRGADEALANAQQLLAKRAGVGGAAILPRAVDGHVPRRTGPK